MTGHLKAVCLLLLLMGAISTQAHAQNETPYTVQFILYTQYQYLRDTMAFTANDQGKLEPVPILDKYQLKALITFDSIPDVETLEITVVSKTNESLISKYTFSFDQETSLYEGFSYSRDGNTILLSLGAFKDALPPYNGTLQMTDSKGEKLSPLQFNSN